MIIPHTQQVTFIKQESSVWGTKMIITLQNLYGWPALSRVNHSAAECHGNCTQHPLMRPEYRLSMADQDELYEAERNAYETDADRAARAAALNAERTARALDDEAIRRECYARDVKERSTMGLRRGEAPKKLGQPCKWVIGEFKGQECWAHEYVDPKTKKRCCPHTCLRLHPGQEGWHNEWFTNRNWKPPQAAPPPPPPSAVRFAALSNGPAPIDARRRSGVAPVAPPPAPKQKQKGRFGALEESDEEISAW